MIDFKAWICDELMSECTVHTHPDEAFRYFFRHPLGAEPYCDLNFLLFLLLLLLSK